MAVKINGVDIADLLNTKHELPVGGQIVIRNMTTSDVTRADLDGYSYMMPSNPEYRIEGYYLPATGETELSKLRTVHKAAESLLNMLDSRATILRHYIDGLEAAVKAVGE